MISTQNLSKTYAHKPVFNAASVDFPEGKITALVGPNGAGKTTFLMMIAGLVTPTSGSVKIDQIPLEDYSKIALAKTLATLRQSPSIHLKLTVEELISFGRYPHSYGHLNKRDHDAINQAIDFLSLNELRHRYIDELSGGQRQMAFLGMAIAQQTKYLLLDEPLNNLDMKHSVQIMQALKRLCETEHRTIIMIVHDINFVSCYADYIVAVKAGQIHLKGDTDAILTEQNLTSIYNIPFKISETEHGKLCNYFKLEGTL